MINAIAVSKANETRLDGIASERGLTRRYILGIINQSVAIGRGDCSGKVDVSDARTYFLVRRLCQLERQLGRR